MEEEVKREIIMDNYLNPINRIDGDLNDESYIKVNSNNSSCIDNINLYIKIENAIINDIKFSGEACAISTSSTSIMIKELTGKKIEEVNKLYNDFVQMINIGDDTNFNNKEAQVYNQIYKQENRKMCALLPWIGIKKGIELNETKK